LADASDTADTSEIETLAKTYGNSKSDRDAAAQVFLAAGRTLIEKDPKAASEYLMRARETAPNSPADTSANKLLARLREDNPTRRPTIANSIYREALITGREANLGAQAELLDRFIKGFPNDSRHDKAVLTRAKTMVRLENRERAAAWLDKKAAKAKRSSSKTAFLAAAASNYWNANATSAALSRYEKVVAMGNGRPEQQRAYYAIGRIKESQRKFNASASAYRKAANTGGETLAKESEWRAGWVSYLAGNFDGAAWVFGKMADARKKETPGTSNGRDEAMYWQARSLERAGKKTKADIVYRALLHESPDGFYAYLAERRTGFIARPPIAVSVETPLSPLPTEVTRAFKRAQELRRAGLEDFAIAEITLSIASAENAVKQAILPQLIEIGAYTSALRTSLDLYRRNLLDENQLYPYIYPRAFESVVVAESEARELDPYFVYSLMRQESLFDPRVVSPAAAYGLMQLLLSTARRMATRANIDAVDVEDLFSPETNVKLGTEYLSELADRFDSDPVLMLAGYNAGETAAERWRERGKDLELDEFIEKISYRETRAYVKKVLRNYRNYLRLYGEIGSGTLRPKQR
jgi:soluble lytic murein transglycosylase-like protein